MKREEFTAVPTVGSTSPSTPSLEQDLSGFARAWARKSSLVTVAFLTLGFGALLSLLFLLRPEWLLDESPFDFLFRADDGLLASLLGNEPVAVARLVVASLLNGALTMVSLAFSMVVAAFAGRHTASAGEFGSYGTFCAAVSRSRMSAGWLEMAAGVIAMVASFLLLVRFGGLGSLSWLHPLLVALCLAPVALGVATLIRLPIAVANAEESPGAPDHEQSTPEPARITGEELLARLKHSSIYRGQVAFSSTLDKLAHDGDSGGLKLLLARYPLLAPLLKPAGVESLTVDQTKALREILAPASGSESQDAVFQGWCGSGRTTLANLLALGSVIHREGSCCWILPGRPDRGVLSTTSATEVRGPDARHPLAHLRRYLEGSPYTELVHMQEGYVDRPGTLHLDLVPDVVAADVRTFQQEVLGKTMGDARAFIERLRFVFIDHPHRLCREDLIRLRIALARLRLTAEMFGRKITFVVLSTRLDNEQGLGKFLLNHDNVPYHEFTGWYQHCNILAWQGTPELFSFDDEVPRFVRTDFVDDVLRLLTELGVQSYRLQSEDAARSSTSSSPSPSADDGKMAGQGRSEPHSATGAGGAGLSDMPSHGDPKSEPPSGDLREARPEAPAKACRPRLPLRVAVVDAQPLLGPEFRKQVSVNVGLTIKKEAGDSDVVDRVEEDWAYFFVPDLAIDLRRHFDVIVCLGIGANPEQLVSSLRPALADHGALILIGDRSAIDVTSLIRMRERGWDPVNSIMHYDYRSLILPEHAEAVVAYELAQLFEDFKDRPLSRERLQGVFPGEHTDLLLTGWTDDGQLRAELVFEHVASNPVPQTIPVLRRASTTLAGSQYLIPYGCCSRRNYRLFDLSANTFVEAVGPEAVTFIDRDRLFIDYHPHTFLKFPPNTVRVVQPRNYELSRDDREALGRRGVTMGRLEVEQRGISANIRIDRRIGRFAATLEGERPFVATEVSQFDQGAIEKLDEDPLAMAVKPSAPSASDETRAAAEVQRRRRGLLASLDRPTLPNGSRLQAVVGNWICDIHEIMRDIVATDTRLIEEPFLTAVETLKPEAASAMDRRMTTTAVSLFVRACQAPSAEEEAALRSFAAHHALGRVLRLHFRHIFVNFDSEYRLLVCGTAPADGLSTWRILFYRLRADELERDNHVGQVIRTADSLTKALKWVHARLEQCRCDDGCSMCCGGLGTVTEAEYKASGDRIRFSEVDVVSRWGAYVLVCQLLGLRVDKDRFTGVPRVDVEQSTDADLKSLVTEVLGTAQGNYRDGLWTRLFADTMVLPPPRVSEASWIASGHEDSAGYYASGENRVYLKRGRTRSQSKETLTHEYTHNWQWVGDAFDLERHVRSGEALRYFEGKLVIEGHATWANNQFRASNGLGPSFAVHDAARWDEYKVGFFLIEGVEKAVGWRGLFEWLARGSESQDHGLRSHNDRLPWPFTLTQALEALRPAGQPDAAPLIQFALGRRFTVDDVQEAASPETAQSAPERQGG